MELGNTLPYIQSEPNNSGVGIAGFVDVETTGLSPNQDEIIELALVLFAFRRDEGRIIGIVQDYLGLREPTRPISPGAFRVHRISGAELRGKQLDAGVIEELILRSEFLVAHNASFDRGFVTRLFHSAAQKPWLCSMKGIDWYQKGCRSRSLSNLLLAHGIKTARSHRADADVMAALRLLTLSDSDGRPYFAELLHRYQVAKCL